jgi:hypothetical protein
VGPRYRYQRPAPHDLAECVGPAHHGNPLGARPLELGVIPGYCRSHHDRPGPIHVAGIVPPPNLNSQGCQIGRPGSVYVTTSYNRTPVFDQQRQGAHPRSADTHEVNGSGITWCK